MSTEHSSTAAKSSSPALWIILASVVSVVVIAGASWWFLFRSTSHDFRYGHYDPPQAAPALVNAVDQHGQSFSLDDYRGKVVFLYFGYTHCPDACPATLDEFMEVKENLGNKADDVAFVMVTVDPSRDSPERMTEYLDFWDPAFHGVSMSQEDTESVAREWSVFFTYEEKNSRGGYLVDHDVSSYVIDKDGNKRLTYPLGADTTTMAKDAEYL
ncbi:MAG TPA: SCO family protein, partial [Thermomicrobiales bacterium]|nr:SCO family protein [Thermomicrobiales bacterium]